MFSVAHIGKTCDDCNGHGIYKVPVPRFHTAMAEWQYCWLHSLNLNHFHTNGKRDVTCEKCHGRGVIEEG